MVVPKQPKKLDDECQIDMMNDVFFILNPI